MFVAHKYRFDPDNLGFWHPFGSYCGLTAQAILDWKRDEALRNGWTLWSFACARSTEGWHDELNRHTGSCPRHPPR